MISFLDWHREIKDQLRALKIENIDFLEFKKSLWSLCLSLFISNTLLSSKKFNKIHKNDKYQIIRYKKERDFEGLIKSINYIKNSKKVESEIQYAVKIFLSRTNWKCIGSGINYNIAKFASKRLVKEINRSCAFDVLENHKHIDISAESSLLIFVSNIFRSGYQSDAYAEIEKLTSHNNVPIIITNIGDTRFDKFYIDIEDRNGVKNNLSVPVIKIPKIDEQFSYTANVLVVEKFIQFMKEYIASDSISLFEKTAIARPSKEKFFENIW